MRKIKCLIADDEVLAREVIKNHIEKIEDLQIVGNCTNGIEVYSFLKNHHVDLLFLDIQMPQLTGIGLLNTLDSLPGVILTTAHREFALESYDLNVLDYLLKPVSFERFLKAINKFMRGIDEITPHIINTKPHLQKANDLDFIYIKSNNKMVRVLIKDIIYLEGLKDAVSVHTTITNVVTYQTLTYFNEKLPEHLFIRVHRSFIISVAHITAYTAAHIEFGKTKVPIGKSYAANVSLKLMVN